MIVGDLIYLCPNGFEDQGEYMGLVLRKKELGSGRRGSTTLYDVLLTDTNELVTISDIYFTMRKV